MTRPMALVLAFFVGFVMPAHGLAQTEGRAALEKFQEWRRSEANAGLDWGDALTKYRQELVVIEAGHTDKPDLVMEYQSNELLKIFDGFRILKYEETVDTYDWGPQEKIRLVRLVAQKPR